MANKSIQKRISVGLPDDVVDEIKRQAKAAGIPVATWIKMTLTSHIRETSTEKE